ncbi:hypothetical protein [Acetobacter peroxydans]|uniref:Lipoprotein n=1 Tax=Acetobacter peroxydans TaxID=104098 RepID=A0A4Y3TU51_9PROT|nr:hypothetical protein [Acetobacter peroxydans]GBR34303.1 hypothetical protein AA13755_0822 [Acetobacter peroxydans NBRC 13755]GBR43625.1 hypothetical protein AA0475_1888 [Acetobacter peroxydans]GEB85926.1 hypothetical protein APE01nite_17230 [Acetobacter peroxydans]
MTEERECKRFGVTLLFSAFVLSSALLAGTPPAAAQDYKMTCPNEHKTMRLSVSGNYHGYPFSEVEKVALQSVACPDDPASRKALRELAAQNLEVNVTIQRYGGQTLRGFVAITLRSGGVTISSSSSSLSQFANSLPPSSLSDNIYTTIQRVWDNLEYLQEQNSTPTQKALGHVS